MTIGDTTKHVISKGKYTTEVVYKTYVGKMKGKAKFKSQTRHERNG